MKSVFWTWPSVTRPGPDQQAIRTAALAARDGLKQVPDTPEVLTARDWSLLGAAHIQDISPNGGRHVYLLLAVPAPWAQTRAHPTIS